MLRKNIFLFLNVLTSLFICFLIQGSVLIGKDSMKDTLNFESIESLSKEVVLESPSFFKASDGENLACYRFFSDEKSKGVFFNSKNSPVGIKFSSIGVK